jgi:hypothetical protein
MKSSDSNRIAARGWERGGGGGVRWGAELLEHYQHSSLRLTIQPPVLTVVREESLETMQLMKAHELTSFKHLPTQNMQQLYVK